HMDGAELISFNNWTMLPHMTALWDGILRDALPRMRTAARRNKTMFFDLADPEKRTREDILGALARLRAFREAGFTVALGLNRKEACEISEALNRPVADYRAEPLEALTRFLYDALGLDCVAVHPVDRAACATEAGYFEAEGPYCAAPRLTTGAGDNFNAGFVFGWLQGFPPGMCLTLGTAVSGYYVRNCHSPDRDEIRAFLRDWRGGRL
ncbi:MAG: carbohydrate kinase family protein, partial [Clostridia bacterium]|nr:carbohydrate kinase family protein [Clostridia bacterium]